MPYTVEVLRKAEKFLRDLRDPALYRRLRDAIDELAESPRPSGCRKLSGSDDLYRLRVGSYRIIYQIVDDRLVIVIIDIGHRREVYR